MTKRYYCPTPITGSAAVLTGPEAHHLIHVMRLKVGSRVVLFDGSGAQFPAEVRATKRDRVSLEVLGRKEVDRELPVCVSLGVAVPKGERQRWLVEKAVELGVARLVPLTTSRAVAQPTAGACQRWRRTVVEACKQCGRNRLMEIAEPVSWVRFVEQSQDAAWRLLAHPGTKVPTAAGPAAELLSSSLDTEEPADPSAQTDERTAQVDPLARMLDDLQHPAGRSATASAPEHSRRVVLAVGPEGGFSGEEVQLARQAGFELVDLGERILRVETAAVALAAAVSLGCRRAGIE